MIHKYKRMNLPVTTSHSQQLPEFCHFCFSVLSALCFFFLNIFLFNVEVFEKIQISFYFIL